MYIHTFVGVVRANFVTVVWLFTGAVQGLDCEHDKCVICELRTSIYKGVM